MTHADQDQFRHTVTSWRSMGEWRSSSPHALTSAVDGDEWSAWSLDRFTPGKESLGPIR